MVCYGLENIADIHKHVTPKQLENFLPNVPLDEPVRPREIHLHISHRKGQFTPQRIKAVGDLILWEGQLWKTVGGTHPKLFEELTVSAHMSKMHFAQSMRAATVKYEELTSRVPEQPLANSQATIQLQESSTAAVSLDFLKWWRWDSIGAACEPKCGSCCCGNC